MNNSRQTVLSHPFFHGMKPAYLDVLADCATEAEFEAGEMLFREGEPANKFYLIKTGKVRLEAHDRVSGTTLVQELGPGDVLGWSWLFPPFVWHFQASATEPMEAVALSGGRLLNVAEHNPEFGYEMMKRVAQVVIHRLQSTRKQLVALAKATEAALES